MDNIIEIVVFLFIIYSIFGSFFGKKKTQQKQGNRIPGNNPAEGVPKRTSSRKDNMDTLEELFGFKLPRTEDTFPHQQTKSSGSEPRTWDPEKEFYTKISKIEDKKLIGKTVPNTKFDKYETIETRQKKRKIEREVKKIDKIKTVKNNRAMDIRSKIDNFETLREFIVISEILDKPKALRR